MPFLLRGCFGCCQKSNELSEKKTENERPSLAKRLRLRCLQKTNASRTEICKSAKERDSILSRFRENMNRPLFNMTERCTIFLRNYKINRRYMQALKSEGLLVTIVSSVASPVLNIAWLFTDGEIANNRQSFHTSSQKSHWDVVVCGGRAEEIIANADYDRYNEPILDGIPCSYWLQVIEPTLPMILDLFSMRHRKTNLSRLRSIGNPIYEDFMSRHGDTFMDQLDQNMLGPHQLLVNRIFNTPFPTMELGTTAALVHNAMANREHQFQEPFRSRRPNHRSRCTTRPRTAFAFSQRGWTSAIATNPNVSTTTQTSTTAEADPDYSDTQEDRDPHWYVPVILQLAECSLLEFPEGSSYRSEDDISDFPYMDVERSQERYIDTNTVDSDDDNIGGRSSAFPSSFLSKFPVATFDDAVAGSSHMGVESCNSNDRIIGSLGGTCEIDEVATTEDTSGSTCALSEVVDGRDIDDYVDLILKNAVTSLKSIQGRLENTHDLPLWYSSSTNIEEPVLSADSHSPCNHDSNSGEASMSARNMEEQSLPSSPSSHLYYDECVEDEMTLVNMNQSASHCKYYVCPHHIGSKVHSNQHRSETTTSAVQRTALPKSKYFFGDRVSTEIAMLNFNQSALHTQHKFRHRCEHSPDTWFYNAEENTYKPAKLRPDTSDLRSWQASMFSYIKEMPDSKICTPMVPNIMKMFEGRKGPVGRRFFVNCATEMLNEIDKNDSTRWIPTKKQRWRFRNHPDVPMSDEEEEANADPEVLHNQRISFVDTRKHKFVNGKRRKVALQKKRRTKQHNKVRVSKNKEVKEMSTLVKDSTDDTDDDLHGIHNSCPPESVKKTLKNVSNQNEEHHSRGDESQESTFPSTRTYSGSSKVTRKGHVSEKTLSNEYASSEKLWKRHIESQNRSINTEEMGVEHNNDVEEDFGNSIHGKGMRRKQRQDPKRNRRSNNAPGRRNGDKSEISHVDQLGEGRNISHECYVGKKVTHHRRSHSQNITSTVQCDTTGSQSITSEKTFSYSNQNFQSQSTKQTACECITQDVTYNRNVSAKKQRYDRQSQRTRLEDSEEVRPTNVQPSNYTEQTRYPTGKYVMGKDDSDTSNEDIQYKKRRSYTKSRRFFHGQTKYASSINDADSSSSSCNYEPRKKTKVRCRKRTTSKVQRNQPVLATGIGLGDHGIGNCCLSNESKQILANQRHNEKAKLWTSGKESSYTASETEVSRSSHGDEETDYDDEDYMDSIKQNNESCMSLERSDDIDAASKDRTEESSSIEWTGSNGIEEEEFSYDTDASSSLLGDEGYVLVNLSDNFHGRNISSSESSTSQQSVHSRCRENTLQSSFFSSDRSSTQYNDSATIKSNHLCFKNSGQHCYKTSDASLPSVMQSQASVDCIDGKYSTNAESSTAAVQKESFDSDMIVYTNQNESAYSATGEKILTQDKYISVETSRSSITEGSSQSSIGVIDLDGSDSDSDESPAVVRDEQARRFYDVGDWATSVDVVRQHRESRRQRGILQYQWNGMYVLSCMYSNILGQRIRRRRVQFRAWLDRRRQRD